jgi:hypothetical protein
MNGYVIGLIAATIGAFLATVGKFFAAKFSSRTDDIISLRETMLKRIAQAENRQAKLEKRQATLEKEVQSWMRRYWGIYRWALNLSVTRKLDIQPPDFHDMDEEQLQQAINEIKQKNDE